MNNERTLYISPEDDLPSICTRLEHAHCRRVTLVLPLHTEHLHSFGTWRMLHAYTRRQGIRVHIVSENSYLRSVAHNARFTVTKTLSESQQDTPLNFPIRRSSTTEAEADMQIGEGINLVFLAQGDQSPQNVPPVRATYMPPTLMFPDDDVSMPPHPSEPAVRVAKPPQPLNMPRARRTRPLTPPRLPWDDVDDDLLPPQPVHSPIRRRTSLFVQTMMQKPRGRRLVVRRQQVSSDIRAFSPIVLIGVFIVVRSLVQYLRKRG